MKVLLTSEFYRPHVGGAETVVQRIAEGLVRRGHEAHVATGADPRRHEEEMNGVRLHQFHVSGNEVKRLRGDVGGYRRFLRAFECDVLFNYAAQNWTTDVAMQELDAIPARRKVLAPCGYSGLATLPRRAAYFLYFRRLAQRLRRYDLLVYHVPGYRDMEFGARHGLDRFTVIPNGVDFAELSSPEGDQRRSDDQPPLVLTVSNHYRLKGHDRFFELADRLGGRARFLLIGTDPGGRSSCYEACRRRARGSPVRLGEGDRESVVGAFRRAELFVLPTVALEVSPLVLIEACAAGVPWVAFDVGNARSLPGGVVVGGLPELAATVERLLGDPAERARLAAAGRAYAGQLAWPAIVRRYEEAFLRLLELN